MNQISPHILQELGQRDRAGLDQAQDYGHIQSLPEIWPLAAARYGSRLAMDDPHNHPSAQLTYQEL